MSTKVQTASNNKVNLKDKSSKRFIENSDLLSQRQIHPGTIIQRARFGPSALTPSDVIQLQRTIGNQAVCRLFPIENTAQLVQRREVCNSDRVCWSEEGPNESYYQSDDTNNFSQDASSSESEQESLTERQTLTRIRQDISLARQLLNDPALSEADRANITQAIENAHNAVDTYEERRSQGNTRTSAMSGIGLAAGAIVADDATAIGVADDPLLILLGIAAIATMIATRPPASQDAISESWLNIGRNMRGLANAIETVVWMTAAGNVIHEHIVNEAKELAVSLGLAASVGAVTRELLCQMLKRLENQYRRSDTDKWKKIIATQKGLGCRGSRAGR